MVNLNGVEAGVVVNLIPDTPLLGKIEHVEVLATGGYKLAKMHTDVDARHAELYSSLETPDMPDDVRAYTYIIIEGREGKTEAYADVWLKSIAVVDKITAKFTLSLDSLDELTVLRRCLQSRGFAPDIVIEEK